MISVFLDCRDDDRALAATLASLVPGAVEGVVRDVVLIDRGMAGGDHAVADQAGCRVVAPEAFREAIDAAKGEWLLFLEPGARLLPGWIEAVEIHCAGGAKGGRAARFTRLREKRSSFFRRLRQIRPALAEGFLVARPQASALARLAGTLEESAKGVAVVRLPAIIQPADNDATSAR